MMRYPQKTEHALALLLLFTLACLVAILGFGVTESRIALMRLSGADSVSFAQLFTNVLAGDGLVSTIAPPYVAQHWFGVHFSPILYMLLPFFALFPSVTTLNILYSFAIALTCIPLYFLCYRIIQDRRLALFMSLLFLLNPFVINAASWDFHEILFAPMLMVGLLWAVYEKRLWLLVICCLLLLMTKEHYGLTVAATGLLWWRVHGERKTAIALILWGVLSLALVLGVIMPHFSPGGAAVMLDASSQIDRYSWLMQPQTWATIILQLAISNIAYVLLLFTPLLFLPLARLWWLLPASADILTSVLSTNELMRSVISYHAAPMIPVLIVAACIALKDSPMKHARKYQWCAVSMIVSIILSALFSPYPNANRNNTWELDRLVWQVPQKTTDMAARLERIMPLETPVAVQSNLMAYLHPLRPMYHFPHQAVPVDWVVQHVFFDLEHSISLLGVPFSSRIEDYLTATKALLEDDAWQIVLAEDHWVVWHKTKNDAPKSQADKKNVQLWLHNVQKNYCMTDMCQNLLSGKNEKYQQFCKICPHSKADIKK